MHHPVWRIFIVVTLLFIAANLYFINVKLFDNIYNVKTAAFTYATSPTPEPTAPSLLCPNNCISIIKEATASKQVAKTTPSPAVQTAVVLTQAPALQVREFFVPLGTGTSSSDSWTDVPGAQAMIDSGQYSGIKSVAFEAAVHVPDHNEGVWVRLYNSTDNYSIGGSELYYTDGNASTLLSTGAISLGSGNKLYKVQMKTQLKFPANLTNARIHILTN